jgi:hypothetical protein
MRKLNGLLAILALTFGAHFAQADVQAPVWNCSVAFDVHGGGLKLLIGSFVLAGNGQVTCVDVAGNIEQFPVRVTMGGTPISLSAGIGGMRLVGLATGVGIAGQPTDILGEYLVGGIRGSFVIGAGADVALHATRRAVTLNAAIQAVSGFGANVGLDFLTIDPIE